MTTFSVSFYSSVSGDRVQCGVSWESGYWWGLGRGTGKMDPVLSTHSHVCVFTRILLCGAKIFRVSTMCINKKKLCMVIKEHFMLIFFSIFLNISDVFGDLNLIYLLFYGSHPNFGWAMLARLFNHITCFTDPDLVFALNPN